MGMLVPPCMKLSTNHNMQFLKLTEKGPTTNFRDRGAPAQILLSTILCLVDLGRSPTPVRMVEIQNMALLGPFPQCVDKFAGSILLFLLLA